MNEVEVSEKFGPLMDLFDDNFHPEIDTVIITGGRYSLKSYTVSIFALVALVNYGWNTLYTRFTNMSIVDSVKPEVSDKIELLGLSGRVLDTQSHIEYNGNRISFKGIKTGSLSQTANLKSLTGFNLFVNDEAEELPDYKTFKKIFYSIRSLDKRNLTILILNPTTKEHWIFKEFFEKKQLSGGDNCIKDNVMYIHSSYLDADQNKIPANILNDYRRLMVDDPKEYENIVLGGWVSELEGQVFPEGSLKRYREFPPDEVDPKDPDKVLQNYLLLHLLILQTRVKIILLCLSRGCTGIEFMFSIVSLTRRISQYRRARFRAR
jgi:phage terminase large subunit